MTAPLRVAAFTAGPDTPSGRFRVRQYRPALAALGVALTEYCPHLGAYPPPQRWLRPAWAVASLAERLPALLAGRTAQVSLIQREMLSTFATLERLTKRPRLFDVDDAIHLHGSAPARIARRVDLVICGNDWLADIYRQWTPRVAVLPTPVDTGRYRPADNAGARRPCLGWIGSAGNLPYLAAIAPALRRALDAAPEAVLEVCCDRPPALPDLPAGRLHYRPWSRAAEADHFAAVTIGLMPLADGDWERGKCSFKMLQYLAHGTACVVSPVGMNREVLAAAEVGFGATTPDAWADALISLLRDPDHGRRLGANGRALVESRYSIAALAPQLAALLRGVAGATAAEPCGCDSTVRR